MRVGRIAAVLALGIIAPVAVAQTQIRRSPPVATHTGFIENRGQWPAEVLFFGQSGGIDATLLRDALVLCPQPDPMTEAWLPPLVIRFPAATTVDGQGALPTAHHFILATGSASYVPGFTRVRYHDVVPGIDLVLRIDTEGFAYDLHARPGAQVEDLVLDVEGADCLEVEDGTVLVMQTAAGRVEQRIGACWEVEQGSGESFPSPSRFRVLEPDGGGLRFGFESPGRDPNRAFVLDPSLVWATYVGGVNQELLRDIHVTPAGAVYLAAKSNSTGPTTPGAFMPVKPGGSNAWVGKLSPDGATLEWATFLGGAATEEVVGVDVDQDGTVVVVGHTFSPDFPTTPGALQPVFAGGNNDLFVTRLAADGSALVWSTFYGGTDFETVTASALFPSGDVMVAASPNGAPPPASPGAFDTVFNPGDQMLVRISADGTVVVFQTYFKAGTFAIALDAESNIYLAGIATALNAPLPTTAGAFKESLAPGDPQDGFVAKMDSLGSQLFWATYLGGDDLTDSVNGIAVDAASAVYVAGQTTSNDFPITGGAFDMTSSNDGGDGFVAKLLSGGSEPVWSTYISACCGGSTLQWDIAVDTAGNAITVGSSNEPNFPTTLDAFQPSYIGSFPSSDAHLTKFDSFGEALVYSTYVGGSSTDNLPLVGLDVGQDPVMALRSSSSNFPVTPGAFDSSHAGSTDTVVAKFDLQLLPWTVMGDGLVGSADTPNLAGTGALAPGSPARLSVRGAAPSAPATIIAGASVVNVPLKGGTLVPSPTIMLPLAINVQGALDLPFVWVNVPAGINLYVQIWIKDVGAPTGFSATNALRLTSQ